MNAQKEACRVIVKYMGWQISNDGDEFFYLHKRWEQLAEIEESFDIIISAVEKYGNQIMSMKDCLMSEYIGSFFDQGVKLEILENPELSIREAAVLALSKAILELDK